VWLAAILVTLAIILVHILGEKFSKHIEKFHRELLSLGAGLMVGIFFLKILPHITLGEQFLGQFVYVFLLIGFILIHILEKYVYQHARSKREVAKDIILFEKAGLAAHGFFIGFFIAVYFEAFEQLAYLIVAPFFIRTFAISVSSAHISEKNESRLYTILKNTPFMIGTLSGLILSSSKVWLFIALSIATGFIVYIIIRDMIPPQKEGRPIYFVVGALVILFITLLNHMG